MQNKNVSIKECVFLLWKKPQIRPGHKHLLPVTSQIQNCFQQICRHSAAMHMSELITQTSFEQRWDTDPRP